MRVFSTGATRDTDLGKPDYDGFLSPLALARFAAYMDKHRVQPDGSLRDSDNWQKGIPLVAYRKSAWRHFMEFWTLSRAGVTGAPIEEALCAILFNVQGYLHEVIKARSADLAGVGPAPAAPVYEVGRIAPHPLAELEKMAGVYVPPKAVRRTAGRRRK